MVASHEILKDAPRLLPFIGALLALLWLAQIIYNLYFHPLAKYPGPLIARSTLLWRCFHSMNGRFHRAIQHSHNTYGSVFRVSPNELSFASANSWKVIYGNPPPGQSHCIKSDFYDVFAAGYDSKCIGSERDPTRHAQMKRNLSPAFSTKALTEQEHVMTKHIDAFISKLRLRGDTLAGLNMTHWYEMLAFDILGDMAFGESFGCINEERPHFWFEMLTKYLLFVTLADNLRRFPLMVMLGRLLSPLTAQMQKKQQLYSRRLVTKRLAREKGQKDFMTSIVGKVRDGKMSSEELTAHASTLVIAGGETIASFFAASTYYLGKNPQCLSRLQREIRSGFKDKSEINAIAAGQLPYLQAVIQEGLRIFPPGSQGFPRISPGVEIDGNWVPRSTEIYTSAWSVTHDAHYFSSPEEFLPERWLESTETSDVKEASQPFSLGLRQCLGRNFAMMEATLLLCHLVYEFDFELVNAQQGWESQCHMHVNWLKPDLPVRFQAREK